MKKFLLSVSDGDFVIIKKALMENDCINGSESDSDIIQLLFFIDEREGDGHGFDLTCRIKVEQI